MYCKELGDLLDCLPYYLIIALPVFIALSPINPVEAASELDVHRLAQYELAGVMHGSKQAALSVDARGPGSSSVLRKAVVARMCDPALSLSVARFRELLAGGAAGFLLLLPAELARVSHQCREAITSLEEELLAGELEVPVYFVQETPDLISLASQLADGDLGAEAGSAAAALLSSVAHSGFQLVVTAPTPHPLKDQSLVSVSGVLPGADRDSLHPTILVVAHYDSAGAAPSLSAGADSNGSGVAVLLELARLFSHAYTSTRAHPTHSLVFLLSGGGKLNYAGTKRWLEEHLDMDTTSDLLANVDFVLCLDSLGSASPPSLHVSKPPKEGSAGDTFLHHLNTAARALGGEHQQVEMVHKKINLADDSLSWEHERFSIRRLPAFTLSSLAAPTAGLRSSLLDTALDTAVLQSNTRLLAEALACSLYQDRLHQCTGQVFAGSLSPSQHSLTGWTNLTRVSTRHPATVAGKQSDTAKLLTAALSRYTQDVVKVVTTPDRREPEYVLYDTPTATLHIYTVKPAVFDLLLSIAIGLYLAALYGLLTHSGTIVSLMAGLLRDREELNGHSKTNGVKNGHKLHVN